MPNASATSPILVTGCPRSGTTWVGNIIAASKDVFSIYEPFNKDAPGNLATPDRFHEITDTSDARVRAECAELVALGKLPRRALMTLPGLGQYRARTRRLAPRLAARQMLKAEGPFLSTGRVCIKDPLAFYSAEWLAREHSAKPVILIRHPCSVISSYLALGWKSEMPALMKHRVPSIPGSLALEVAAYRDTPTSDLHALILQWKVMAAKTLEYSKRHPNWKFVVHDLLCQWPEKQFEEIFAYLDLDLTDQIRERIRSESSPDNVVDPRKHTQHAHSRASRDLVDAWRTRLEPALADQILADTNELWRMVLRAFTPELETVATSA